jgi:hypothetical protein
MKYPGTHFRPSWVLNLPKYRRIDQIVIKPLAKS